MPFGDGVVGCPTPAADIRPTPGVPASSRLSVTILLLLLFLTKIRSVSLAWTPIRLIRPYETVKTLDVDGVLTRTVMLPKAPSPSDDDGDDDADVVRRRRNHQHHGDVYRERSDRNLAVEDPMTSAFFQKRIHHHHHHHDPYRYPYEEDDLDFSNSDVVTGMAVDDAVTDVPEESGDGDGTDASIQDEDDEAVIQTDSAKEVVTPDATTTQTSGEGVAGVTSTVMYTVMKPSGNQTTGSDGETNVTFRHVEDMMGRLGGSSEMEVLMMGGGAGAGTTTSPPMVDIGGGRRAVVVQQKKTRRKQAGEAASGRRRAGDSAAVAQVEVLEEKDPRDGADVQTFSVRFDNGTVWRFRRMRRRRPEEVVDVVDYKPPPVTASASLAVATSRPPRRGATFAATAINDAPKRGGFVTQSAAQRRPAADNAIFDAGKMHIKNKLAKFLNLFTVIQFSNDPCVTGDGLKGTCYHHLECRSQGGVPSGPCAQGYGTCCVFQNSCGDITTQNCTYFVDPGVTSNIRECTLDIVKSHPDVSQIRLDFANFELVGPTNGSCIDDQFIVSGQNRNSIIPALCGINTGQHVYIDVTTTVSPVRLSIVTQMRNLDRHYRIKVTQVLKGSPPEAPRNCLQYYWGPTGTIESFNYQSLLNNRIITPAGYLNNLNYAICIRKEDSYCSITFNNADPFQLTNVDENGVSLISPRQAGVEIFDCPDDYIVLNGLRMCGEKLNDASGDVDYTRDAPVTETTNGPFIVTVRTNGAYNGRGFRISFAQSPCT